MNKLRESARAFRDVFRNKDLRRLELAWAGSIIGTWAYGIAVVVYSYEHGGATAVGVVGLIRWTAAAIAQPFTAALGDRYDRRLVMVASDVARAALIGGAAVAAFAGAPAIIVYLLAGGVSVSATAFRPAEASLTPALARTPEELTAANVVSSTIESVGIFLGPALGGLLLAASGPGSVFAVGAALVTWATVLIAGVRDPRGAADRPEPEPIKDELLAGARTILGERRLRLVVGLFTAQLFVDGMLNVLLVVVALKLLDTGRAGVGFLNSAVGVGGLLGAVAAMALVGRKRLASDFGLGIFLWGLPIALVAVWPNQVFALVLLGILGIGNTLVDVSGMTLLQRAAPEAVVARVFGVLESLFLIASALGAIVAPLLLGWLGTRGALIVTGALLPLLILPSWPTLSAIDRSAAVPAERLALLLKIPIFAPLPAATIERLATKLAVVDVPAGQTLFSAGDDGDLFYVVDDGEVEIVTDGKPPVVLNHGEFFGEIALLRDVPRTATVRARTDAKLYALGRNDFVPAVTGYVASRDAADQVISVRMGPERPGLLRA